MADPVDDITPEQIQQLHNQINQLNRDAEHIGAEVVGLVDRIQYVAVIPCCLITYFAVISYISLLYCTERCSCLGDGITATHCIPNPNTDADDDETVPFLEGIKRRPIQFDFLYYHRAAGYRVIP